MKNLYFTLIVSFALISCTKDLITDIARIVPENTTNRHFEIIRSLGFNTDSIIELDDCYIVEGDIAIDKQGIESYMPEKQTRQARWGHKLSSGVVNDKITVSTIFLANAGWERALLAAMKEWNKIPNCKIEFKHQDVAKVYANMDATISSGTVAYANMPVGGAPGVGIRINPDYNGLSHESKVSVMVHELGHVIGLGHTNYKARGEKEGTSDNRTSHISGTPREEWDSVMTTGSSGRPWGTPRANGLGVYGFTPGDILVVQRLYGNPDYTLYITGPERLSPGQTATYNITYGSVVGNYAGDFDATVWTTDEQIVSQTNTSITIRCNHAATHRITLSVSCNYNGVTMRGSMVINPVIHYCYNQTYNSASTYTGNAIFVQNVTVRNGASLTLQAPSITIEQPFTVEVGATFYMGE